MYISTNIFVYVCLRTAQHTYGGQKTLHQWPLPIKPSRWPKCINLKVKSQLAEEELKVEEELSVNTSKHRNHKEMSSH